LANGHCAIVAGWTSTSSTSPDLTRQSLTAPQQRDKGKLKRDPRFASTADSSTPSTQSLRATLDSEPSAQRQTSSRERNPQNAEARASHALMPLDKVVRIIACRLSAKDILQTSCIRLERASSKCSRNPTTLSTGSNSSQPRLRGISLRSQSISQHGVASLESLPTPRRSAFTNRELQIKLKQASQRSRPSIQYRDNHDRGSSAVAQ